VWQPLGPHLQGASSVLVSADGALTRLPLAALPGSQPGTYLLEEVPLAVVPVPQLLARGGPAAKGHAAAPSLLLWFCAGETRQEFLPEAPGGRSCVLAAEVMSPG
jgi:hypothetical protein